MSDDVILPASVTDPGDGLHACRVCGVFVLRPSDHDRQTHEIAALERLAAAIEGVTLRLDAGRQLRWLEEMERVEREVFPDSRPRSEVVVPCTCLAGLDPHCPIHGSSAR